MAAYLAMRIEQGKLNLNAVTAKYPQYEAAIRSIIIGDGYTINEDGTVSK